MMTNDPLTIICDTARYYFPGKVFVRDEKNVWGEVTRYDEKLYDTKTKNFHICPADETLRSSLRKKYDDMREKLRIAFEDYFREIKEDNKKITLNKLDKMEYTFIGFGTDRTELPEGYQSNSDMIFLFWGVGKNGGKGELRLYRFLTFFYKGAWYRINFMRMYHDGKYVHCHMNELQYDKEMSRNNIKIDGYSLNKEKDENFGICYPPSCNAGDFGTNDSGNIVYNPDDVFYPHEEKDLEEIKPEFFLEIVTSFLSFVVDKSDSITKDSV